MHFVLVTWTAVIGASLQRISATGRRVGRWWPAWLLPVCAVCAGCAHEPGGTSVSAPPAAGPGAVRFTDVTEEAGLGSFVHRTGAFGQKWLPETMGAGAAFVDYDGDGWEDVLLVGGGSWPQEGQPPVQALRLYRNNGDGSFSERTREAGLDGISTYGFGIAAADYDNDGDQDLFLTTLEENLLFRNEGGRFTEVGRAAGLADHRAWSSAALFFDADHDAFLDLYVGNYVKWSPETDIPCIIAGNEKAYCTPSLYEGEQARFYRNNGDGTFTEAAERAGFGGGPGNTLGAAELDVNDDGWSDLVVANDMQRDLLYVNNGDGTFTERGTVSGMAFDVNGKARGGMGIDAGVTDSSGHVSLFVGNFAQEMIGVYRHVGDGLFQDRAAVSKIGRPSLPMVTFGLFLFDADLDTDLDLLAVNGHIRDNIEKQRDASTYRQPVQLFLNSGSGTFNLAEAGPGSVLSRGLVGRGAAYADYDHDGDIDVLITENGGGAHLWRNEHRSPAYLRIRLESRSSNRDGVGARLIAHVGGLRMERRVRTGSSYLSQSEKTVTFGLGSHAAVDSLVVYWPSGRIDRFGPVMGGQQVRITEGKSPEPEHFQRAGPNAPEQASRR